MATSRKSVTQPTTKTNPHPPRATGQTPSKGRISRAPTRPVRRSR